MSTIREYRGITVRGVLHFLFIVFCFIPFLFPNPIIKTNNQPYSALLGTLIVLVDFKDLFEYNYSKKTFVILGFTFFVALLAMVFGTVDMNSLRGLYNYYALFIVPCASMLVFKRLDEIPERLIKAMILIWFFVSSVQFFIFRGFATGIIAGVRWSYALRGVVGLASEPSFFGIACFLFLHFIQRFQTKRTLYIIITIVMGTLYSQSTTGILFILGYIVSYMFETINRRRGFLIWMASIVAVIVFIAYVNKNLVGTRIHQLLTSFLDGGVDSVLEDGSASVRFNAIINSLEDSAENYFLPFGFSRRIGSAYGGMLVEIGFFAFPAIVYISRSFSLSFTKKRTRILYFFVVTFLLLNNTQIGNPMMLLLLGMNRWLFHEKKAILQTERGYENMKLRYQNAQL